MISSSSIISYVALTVTPRRNQFTLSNYLSRVSSTYRKQSRESTQTNLFSGNHDALPRDHPRFRRGRDCTSGRFIAPTGVGVLVRPSSRPSNNRPSISGGGVVVVVVVVDGGALPPRHGVRTRRRRRPSAVVAAGPPPLRVRGCRRGRRPPPRPSVVRGDDDGQGIANRRPRHIPRAHIDDTPPPRIGPVGQGPHRPQDAAGEPAVELGRRPEHAG